jgi:hypothetical protein
MPACNGRKSTCRHIEAGPYHQAALTAKAWRQEQEGHELTQAELSQEGRGPLELKAAAVDDHVSRQHAAICQAHAGLIHCCGRAHNVPDLPGARKLEVLVVALACTSTVYSFKSLLHVSCRHVDLQLLMPQGNMQRQSCMPVKSMSRGSPLGARCARPQGR